MNRTNQNNFGYIALGYMNELSVIKEVVSLITRVVLLSIGSFIQLKIISVCKKEKDKTWQIEISHSIAMMVLFSFAIIFESIIRHIPNLSEYTGVSICYITAVIYVYCPYIVAFHSLIVSSMKYIFIVHHQKVLRYGEDKIKEIFFWINLIHPFLLGIATVSLFDFESFRSLILCFDLQDQLLERYNSTRGNLERMFLCKLASFDGEDPYAHIAYVFTQGFCVIKMVYTILLSSNIPEAYFYYTIFKKMKRY